MPTLRDYINKTREAGKTPTFTNIEGSSTFSEMPEEDVYTFPEYRETPGGGMQPIAEESRKAGAMPSWVAPRGQPPTRQATSGATKPIDFSRGIDYDRPDIFEQTSYKVVGGNPNEIDVIGETDKRYEAGLDDFFVSIFPDRLYRDEANLDPKKKAYWEDSKQQYRAQIEKEVKQDKAMQLARHSKNMDMFYRMRGIHLAEKKKEEEAVAKIGAQKKERKENREKLIKRQIALTSQLAQTQKELREKQQEARDNYVDESEIQAMETHYKPLIEMVQDRLSTISKELNKYEEPIQEQNFGALPPSSEFEQEGKTVSAADQAATKSVSDAGESPQVANSADSWIKSSLERIKGKASQVASQKPSSPKRPAPPETKKKVIESFSMTDPPAGMPIGEALDKMGVGKENWESFAKIAADIAGYTYEEFLKQPYNVIVDALKKTYSKEGREEGRKQFSAYQ